MNKILGEGAKKKVYLGLDDTSRTRIQREAQAMGRPGSHPHIVTIFDLGEEQDQPYMVTELMGGGAVEGLIGDAEGHRLPLEHPSRS